MCADSNRCTTNLPLTSRRTVRTWQASSPLIISMVNWQIRRILLSRCALCPICLVSIRSLRYLFKSIVALRAASEIFQILGDNDKSQEYNVRLLSSFIVEAHLIRVPAAVYRQLTPGTMAENGARVGPVSLYAFLRKQHFVSVTCAVIVMILRVAISWGLLYNLYADRLLDFDMFPLSVYETR